MLTCASWRRMLVVASLPMPNIGVLVRLNNSNPRRMFGGVRMLSARIFARLRKGAQNFVAQKLARCGSAIVARFLRNKLDCTYEFKLNPLLDRCQCFATRKMHAPQHTAIPVGCHLAGHQQGLVRPLRAGAPGAAHSLPNWPRSPPAYPPIRVTLCRVPDYAEHLA